MGSQLEEVSLAGGFLCSWRMVRPMVVLLPPFLGQMGPKGPL